MSEISIQRKRRRPVIIIGLLFLITVILGGYLFMGRQYSPVDPNDKQPIDVIIPASSSARDIAVLLDDKDLIRNQAAFLSYCRKNQLDSQLKAGHYRFSRSQSVADIAGYIARGSVVTLTITIPEGYTVKQIGDLFIKQGLFERSEWDSALQAEYSFSFLDDSSSEVNNKLEGFLYPETYVVPEDITAQEMIQHMLSTFDSVWNKKYAALADQQGLTVQEVVTMASLVEREAQVGSERSVISGVIHNRLDIGMPLQIDAAIQYCLPDHKEVLTYADLEVDSPYNTYKNTGLPPGPIANPGQASMEAALKPDQHDYLYYVAKGDGSHQFSRTHEEHIAAKQRYIN